MIKITEFKEKEYYVTLKGLALFSTDTGEALYETLISLLKKDVHIVIDFEEIKKISSGGFNRLFDLFSEANKNGCKISITNDREEVEELIGLLTLTR